MEQVHALSDQNLSKCNLSQTALRKNYDQIRIENDKCKMDVLLEYTIQRFKNIPKDIREQIWNAFFNLLKVVSFELIEHKGTIELVMMSIISYIVQFFSLGIWWLCMGSFANFR